MQEVITPQHEELIKFVYECKLKRFMLICIHKI